MSGKSVLKHGKPSGNGDAVENLNCSEPSEKGDPIYSSTNTGDTQVINS